MSKVHIRYADDGAGFMGCGCVVWIAVLAFNLLIGSMAVNYLLAVWLSKDIPWFGDMIIGLFTAEFAVPAAIVTWLLKIFGAM